MKNREKFREEIVEAIKDDNPSNEKLCCFVQNNTIPRFVPKEYMEGSACGGMSCQTCAKMFTLWLDEEYEEPQKPEVDWSKVPVDTLVRVWDTRAYECVLRYFKGIDDSNPTRKYVAWAKGATSVTAYGQVTHWKHCELAEDAAETERVNRWRMKN